MNLNPEVFYGFVWYFCVFSTVQTKNTYFPKPILMKEVAPGAASGGPRWGVHGPILGSKRGRYPPFCLNKAMEKSMNITISNR